LKRVSPGGVPRFERRIRRWYARWVRPRLSRELDLQRVKLCYFALGYWPLLRVRTIGLRDRLGLVARFLRIDWYVLHSHRPREIAQVCAALAARPARPGEVMVEAGCWNGGSSAKLSLMCRLLGYRLRIYDSFEGVELRDAAAASNEYDFSGEYVASDATLRGNLERFGAAEVCSIHPGWFEATLARAPVPDVVGAAFIDCDAAKGTREVLFGVVPNLARDGVIFSQDFHIPSVRELLQDPRTWERFGRGAPRIERLGRQLAAVRFAEYAERRVLGDRRRGQERRIADWHMGQRRGPDRRLAGRRA
jgi:O-methyltransferase